jgi:hypothetical protein
MTLLAGGAMLATDYITTPAQVHLDWNYPTAKGVVDKTLEVLGAGIRIAIEAAVMATDAGEVGEGAEIISCAGTFKGLDTALAESVLCGGDG